MLALKLRSELELTTSEGKVIHKFIFILVKRYFHKSCWN